MAEKVELSPEEQEALKGGAMAPKEPIPPPEINPDEDLESVEVSERTKTDLEAPKEEKEGEETPKEPQLSKEDKSKLESFDRIYKRMKEAEAKLKEQKSAQPEEVEDIDKIVSVQRATKDLDSDEIAELRLKAKAKNITLEKAREDENFKVWLEARRAKVAKEGNIPAPSAPGRREAFGEKEITPDMPKEERDKIMKERLAASQRESAGI